MELGGSTSSAADPQSRGQAQASNKPTEVTVAPLDEVAAGISFTVDYASGNQSKSGDFTVIPSSDSSESTAYVQPTPAGVRILTAIASSRASDSYSYSFDVPDGTTLVHTGSVYRLQPPEGPAIGTIQEAWARDSEGHPLKSSYSWEGKTLTQHVDLKTPGITFPILIDPYWNYSAAYDLNKTASQVDYLLHACFNCYFPVAGAPYNFPSYGQDLPLTVGFLGVNANFHCTMDIVARDTNAFMFQFLSASGHIDGPGSAISFTFYSGGGSKHMYVDAYVTNDFGPWGSLNGAYVAGAKQTWQSFANNLNGSLS